MWVENIRTLVMYEVPLCIECEGCGRRATMEPADLLPYSGSGEMASLASLAARMRCSRCGRKGMRWERPASREEAIRFVRGI